MINIVDIYTIINNEFSTHQDVSEEQCWALACKVHAKYSSYKLLPKYNSTTHGVDRYECSACGKEVTGYNYCPRCGVKLI